MAETMRIFPHVGLNFLYPRYRAAGGVMDFLAFLPEAADPVDAEALHRAAAIAAIESLTGAMNFHAITCLKRGYLETLPEPWALEPERAVGTKIRWRQFTGEEEGDPHAGNSFTALFAYPPHGLGLKEEEIELLLETSFRELMPALDVEPVVYSWTTDWADYFKDGLEWWGAALWTIGCDHGGAVIVIAVSATD